MGRDSEQQDIRVITLCKQHYFDQYDEEGMRCDYSSWGYYDGIIISDEIQVEEQVHKKTGNHRIFQIWSEIGNAVEALNGSYSKQNIGVFRCRQKGADVGDLFWEKYQKGSPYLAIGFVQLNNREDYEYSKKCIERELNQTVNCLVYFTFDNADIVVIVHSDSLTKLCLAIKKIEEMQNISYVHSVLGVSEKYLDCCGDNIISTWNGVDCHIREPLAEVSISIATSGMKDLETKIGACLKGQVRRGVYSYAYGHKSIVIRILDTNVKTLLGWMRKGGFLTHQNSLYGNGVINMETEIRVNICSLPNGMSEELFPQYSGQESLTSWCQTIIEWCYEQKQKSKETQDDAMRAYWRAIIQTLNTLTQYERFDMSKPVFYLLFPVMNMFIDQLKTAIDNKSLSVGNLNQIKEAIEEFITDVNAVIYHMVHTDQMFLMIPGYSGTSYSIPLKLCLFYQGITKKIIAVLNDSEHKYNCFLVPRMESRTVTKLIHMGVCPDDRLVSFFVSQRILYQPRYFLFILCHELAHYVGTNVRMRKYRSQLLVELLSLYLVEGVIPDRILRVEGIEDEKYSSLVRVLSDCMKKNAKTYLKKELLKERERDKKIDHSIYVEKFLQKECQNFLINELQNMREQIDLNDVIEECDNDFSEVMKVFELLQRRIERNRLVMLATNSIGFILKEMIVLFQEIFSDTVAFTLLEGDFNTYKEAFDISEGEKLEDGCRRNMQEDARKIIMYEMFGTSTESLGVASCNSESKIFPYEWPNQYHKVMYEYVWLKDALKAYAMQCKKQIAKLVNENTNKDISKAFQLFCDKKKNCQEIYKGINQEIVKYTDETKKEYQNILESMKKDSK